MKVLAISSSNRKKNTYSIISQVKDILNDSNIEVEILHLFDYQIKACIGCEMCILNNTCVFNDDVAFIMKKLSQSDGIILSSPVYLQSISGKLKTFVDRTCVWYHRPELFGKPLLAITTTKGSGLKKTLNYLQSIATQWGAYNSGRIGRTIRTIDLPVTKKECAMFIDNINRKKSEYTPTLKSILNFNTQKVLSKYLVGLDEAYWNERGWYDKPYYFKCKVNPINRFLGYLTYNFLSNVMNKE